MPTPTTENYLKALFHLADDAGNTTLSELAKQLGVSAPTANSMIKKLKKRGLVFHQKYQPIQLTDSGRKEAALIIRKHRLTEMYLVEKMGFGWEQVHEIAEQMEHLKAPAFFERMDEILGRPQLDPHGSPIPAKDGSIHHHAYHKLSDCELGQRVRLSAVMEADDGFLHFLNEREIALGTPFHILEKTSFDGSLRVSYPGHNAEVLSKMVAERLLVVMDE